MSPKSVRFLLNICFSYRSSCSINPVLGLTVGRQSFKRILASRRLMCFTFMRYASATVELLLRPMWQWIKTRFDEFVSKADEMNRVVSSSHENRLELAASSSKILMAFSFGIESLISVCKVTFTTCVMPSLFNTFLFRECLAVPIKILSSTTSDGQVCILLCTSFPDNVLPKNGYLKIKDWKESDRLKKKIFFSSSKLPITPELSLYL